MAIMIVTGAILFQVGVEQVVHVLVAEDRLGMTADGVGVLSAAVGVGGLVIAPFTARLGASRFAGLMLAGAGVVFGLAMATLATVSSSPSAIAVLAVQGMGVMVFEVVFITLLQRWCREDALARVFGLNDSLASATQLLGALAAPVLIAGPGLNGALWLTGGFVVVVSLAVAPTLHREAVRSADELRGLEPTIVRLRDLGIFGEAPRASLERLARSVTRRHVDAGSVVFDEGDQPDDLFVIDGGEFIASSAAEGELNRMHVGDWFGEIGLLRSIPRTATVTAATEGDLWVIDGRVFVDALAGPERLPDPLHRTMTTRLARTHPGILVET
jgi:MFS family permease